MLRTSPIKRMSAPMHSFQLYFEVAFIASGLTSMLPKKDRSVLGQDCCPDLRIPSLEFLEIQNSGKRAGSVPERSDVHGFE